LSAIASKADKKLQRSLSGSIQMRFTTGKIKFYCFFFRLILFLSIKTKGVVYDDETLKHECYCKRTDLHLENPRRLLIIYEQLKKSNLLDDCEIIHSYCATIDTLTDCHK